MRRSSWIGLAEMVPHARTRRAVEGAPSGAPLLDRVQSVAVDLWGDLEDVDDRAAAAGIAALAIKSRCAPEIWLVRPGASRLIRETDLHAIPDSPPRLLTAPGIVQAHRTETGDRLWGDFASLGWCHVDGGIYLYGIGGPHAPGSDRIAWAACQWTPQWTGEALGPQLPTLDLASPLIRDHGEHQAFSASAAQYLIVLGLLAEADNSPLQIDLDRQTRWRHVRVDSRRAPTSRPSTTEPVSARDARLPEQSQVTGHLKRQRYGAGLSLTKWIYVQGYSARRWHARRWIVSQRDNTNAERQYDPNPE